MAKGGGHLTFNKLYQEGRKHKRDADLAQEIFGSKQQPKSRSSLGKGGIQKSHSIKSLDARIASQEPSGSRSKNARKGNNNGLLLAAKAVLEEQSRNARAPRTARSIPITKPAELQIRGAAGPYTVIAENFATGTTAADIESVMQSVGGEILSCKLIAKSPACTAEIAFASKSGADDVIRTFDNKKADGRILRVCFQEEYRAQDSTAFVAAPTHQDQMMDVDDVTGDTTRGNGYRDRQPYARSHDKSDRSRPDYRQDPQYAYDTPSARLGYRNINSGYAQQESYWTKPAGSGYSQSNGRERYGR